MKKEKVIGIYCIENLINNKKYIGSSVDIYSRWLKHKSVLNNNKHNWHIFQNDWNKFKASNFKFYIIEECTKDCLLKREQYWMDYYNSYNVGYNKAIKADRTEPTPEIRNKISQSLVGRCACEKSVHTKLKNSQVKKIINLLLDNKLTYLEIANICDTTENVIRNIKNKKSWKQLTKYIDFPKRNTHSAGEKNNASKLTINNVSNIIERLKNKESVTQIAKDFNVSTTCIKSIRSKSTWNFLSKNVDF